METPNKVTNKSTEDNFNGLSTKVLIEYLIEGTLKNRVCRYCLCENNQLVDVCDTLNIQFLHEKQQVTIKDIIRVVYPTKISQTKDLPKKICNKCIANAISSYQFIQQCHISETCLRSCIDNLYQNVTTLDANYTRNNKDRGIVLNVDHEKVINYASPILYTSKNDEELLLMTEEHEKYSLINSESIFECSKCKLDFSCIKTFVHHQKSHKTTDKHVCRTCGAEFAIYKIYLTHIHEAHKILNAHRNITKKKKSVKNYCFKCDCCQKVFSSWYNFMKHRDKHKIKKTMDCIFNGTLKENICQICLKETKELISIFQTVCLYGAHWTMNNTYILSEIISQIFPLKVSHLYDMHSQICESCIQSVITSYILHKQYQFSECLLTSCFDEIQLYNNEADYSVNCDVRKMFFSVHLDKLYKNLVMGLQFKCDVINIGEKRVISNARVNYTKLGGNNNASVDPLKVKNILQAESLSNETVLKVEILNISDKDLQDPLVIEKEIISCLDSEKCVMKTHPCTMCMKNFLTLLELLKHLKCHPNGTSHLCRNCGLFFLQISALHLHASETHGKESYLYSLKRSSEWEPATIMEEVDIKRSPSSDNSEVSQSDINNEVVKQIKSEIKQDQEIFECTMCTRYFKCQSVLDKHYNTHKPGTLHICRICNKKYTQLNFLIKHKLAHEHQKKLSKDAIYPHGCSSSKTTFNNKAVQDRHKMLHKTKQCRYCKKNILVVLYASHLLTHSDLLRKLEEEENEKSKLVKVERRRNRINEMEKEKRENEREKTPPETPHVYRCDKCPQVASSKRTLMVHLNKVHLHVKPYACHICDKSFYGPYHLKEHILTHSNTKPEICEICGNRFVNKKSLMYHKRLHTNERPHKCNECSESFICATRLRNHVRKIHKPWDFICRFCERKFYDKVLMNKHINGVHLNIKRKRKSKCD